MIVPRLTFLARTDRTYDSAAQAARTDHAGLLAHPPTRWCVSESEYTPVLASAKEPCQHDRTRWFSSWSVRPHAGTCRVLRLRAVSPEQTGHTSRRLRSHVTPGPVWPGARPWAPPVTPAKPSEPTAC